MADGGFLGTGGSVDVLGSLERCSAAVQIHVQIYRYQYVAACGSGDGHSMYRHFDDHPAKGKSCQKCDVEM